MHACARSIAAASLSVSLLSACSSPPATTVVPQPAAAAIREGLRFSIRVAPTVWHEPLSGRLLLVIAKADPAATGNLFEQVTENAGTAQIFGVDVDGLAGAQPVAIDQRAYGYPLTTLNDLPPGDYQVQALLHRYETFARGDGHTLKLPPATSAGQDWKAAPGNLISACLAVHLDPGHPAEIALELSQVIPEPPPEADTAYVKHVQFKSERLSKFWGRPTFIGAVVILPEGFSSHPNARYPLVIEHGHYEREVANFRETPPDDKLPPADLERLSLECPNGHEKELCVKYGLERLNQEHGYQFYKLWTGPHFPRVLIVAIQHANPYYDDSYAVNSENVGPYGDAITYELIPYLEKEFRGQGPWARAMMGGSTGGWEALAAQIFYPEQYNGAVVNCPDPIDFHAYETVNLYGDANAYYAEGPFQKIRKPGSRGYRGEIRSMVEGENHLELVLGTRGRSGGQWDVWQAVYSPVGEDGYPKPIWNKETGAIDPAVAAYWREHYDLVHILGRDWAKLAPQLRGKLTINVGLSDNFFLNDAVYLADDFLKSAKPPADAHVDYGLRDEHCWSGDHEHPNVVARMTYRERFIPAFVEHWLKTAPAGADVKSWRY